MLTNQLTFLLLIERRTCKLGLCEFCQFTVWEYIWNATPHAKQSRASQLFLRYIYSIFVAIELSHRQKHSGKVVSLQPFFIWITILFNFRGGS